MYYFLSKKITAFFIEKNILKPQYREMCEYTVGHKIQEFFLNIILCIICLPKLAIWEIPLFLFAILALRKRTGGYHASSPEKCAVLSLILISSSIYFILPFIELISLPFQYLLYIVIAIVLGVMAPINNPNLNFTKAELKANKNKVIHLLVVIFFITLAISQIILLDFFALITLSLFDVTASVLFAKIIGQEVK